MFCCESASPSGALGLFRRSQCCPPQGGGGAGPGTLSLRPCSHQDLQCQRDQEAGISDSPGAKNPTQGEETQVHSVPQKQRSLAGW